MPYTPAEFRERARHCRELARSAPDEVVANTLRLLASDFEEEADALASKTRSES
jgi:hypothetical protein